MKDNDSCGGTDREAICFAFLVPGTGILQRLKGVFAHAGGRLVAMLAFSLFLMQATLAQSYTWGTDPARWSGLSKPGSEATGVELLVSSAAGLAQATADIRLKSRDLPVTPNREDRLRAITAIPEGASRHVIVKLDHTPNPEERRSLAVHRKWWLVRLSTRSNHSCFARIGAG